MLPPLAVRRARVQDHDELLPLLQRAARRCPSLARLPESCRPDEPFALARLIASQDADNALLVAQQRGGDQLVGFAVATCDVDVPLLNLAFDLGPFDGFIDPDVYERLEDKARALAAKEAPASGEAGALPAAVLEDAARRHLAGLIQSELAAAGSKAAGGGSGHGLLALTMLCMEPECEAQASNLLWAAFEAFPGKVRACPGEV